MLASSWSRPAAAMSSAEVRLVLGTAEGFIRGLVMPVDEKGNNARAVRLGIRIFFALCLAERTGLMSWSPVPRGIGREHRGARARPGDGGAAVLDRTRPRRGRVQRHGNDRAGAHHVQTRA
ncbi:hypothetical protein BRADI_4g08979v3 [Brachypodium distachyon]|uniref:Uncharacterized protein n=1 Tax=Brachypodium distachyon TaxID=15368 RepID=A0A2K2CLF6_BRADI|nr:hypothetical protein BRADI_4g08979v3 [Brachypodium distachyon]